MIETGRIVALKSGGPLMTVKYNLTTSTIAMSIGKEFGVHCCWIDEFGVPHTEVYREEMLRVKREETDDPA